MKKNTKTYIIGSANMAQIIANNKIISFNRSPAKLQQGCCAIIDDIEIQKAIEKRDDFGMYISLLSTETEQNTNDDKENDDAKTGVEAITSSPKAKLFLLEIEDISEEDKSKIAACSSAPELKEFALSLGYEFPNWR